jgi:hypothetical protein
MAAMDVHLVRVTTDDRQHQLWAAAGPRGRATELILSAIPDGWAAVLLSSTLTAKQLEVLNLKPGEVREITLNRRPHEPLINQDGRSLDSGHN